MPGDPLLAEPLYLTKYIERMGTGTGDMIRWCREVGLPEPLFSISDGFVTTIWRKPREITGQVTGEVTGEVERVVLVMQGEMKRVELFIVLLLIDINQISHGVLDGARKKSGAERF